VKGGKMNRLVRMTSIAVAISSALMATVQAEEFSFAEAMKQGDVKLSFRARYENVNQENALENANALTNRTRLSFSSAAFGHWKLNVEMDNVAAPVADYNSKVNGLTQYSVIADPEGTDLNLANLAYSNGGTTFIAGRQRINLDGQRFVGGVGWRQNEQTYDALMLNKSISPDFSVNYAYVHNVNNILGNNIFGDNHILNASYNLTKDHSLGFTGVFLDPDNAQAIGSTTVGFDYKGKAGIAQWNLAWATQSDDGEAPIDYQADYLLTELQLNFKPVALTVGYEVLGSDQGKKGFTTPLATLHKFQGFADMFLVTPDNGVQDTYVKLSSKVGSANLALIYHDFAADYGNANYGDEIDLVANFKINSQYALLFKYASYSADTFAVDTDKVWLMLSAQY
jgi:hypothetical protein